MNQPEDLTREIAALRTEVRLLRELVTEVLGLRRPAPLSTRRAARLLEVRTERLARLIKLSPTAAAPV